MAAPTLALVLAAAALVGVVLVALVTVLGLRAERRRGSAAVAELAALGERLANLETGSGTRAAHSGADVPCSAPTVAEFVITDLGTPGAGGGSAPGAGSDTRERILADRVVLGAALGEPLVRGIALAHGLRRALAPASRNHIRFEVRQEVRRARRRRRQESRDARAAWRQVPAEDGSAA